MDRLQELLEDGVIDEVFNQLKSGKEAEVWLVSHHGEPVAAKIYKAREFRSFKNDAGYKEGRLVRNTRTQRAMDKGSKFGREASEEAWKSAEAEALFELFAAGVRVPKPVLFYEGVLLMEVIGDAEGRVAPRLVDANLTREQAGPMYLQLRAEVIKMLAADWIHGDLSEFNVLLSKSGPVIIDFPQVVTAAKNSSSEQYFRRDMGNMVRFFSSLDPTLAKHATDADEIWHAYVRRHLTARFEPTGRGVPVQQPKRGQGGQQRGAGGAPQQGRGGAQPREQRGPGGAPQQGRGGGQPREPRGPGGAPEPSRGGGQPREQRGPGGAPQQARGGGQPHEQRGPGGAPQQGRGGGQPNEQRGPGGQPQQGRGPGGPAPQQQQQQQRGPGGQPQQPRGPAAQPSQQPRGQARPARRGPEVVIRGQGPSSSGPSSSGGPRGGGAQRRRPPRRF